MLCAHCGGTYPFVVNLDAILHDSFNHLVAAQSMVTNVYAAVFPSFEHDIHAVPVLGNHHTIVRWLVNIFNFFLAHAFLSFQRPTQIVKRMLSCRQIQFKWMSVNVDSFSGKEFVHFLATDRFLFNLDTLVLNNGGHVFFTDESFAHFETGAVLEGRIEVIWAQNGPKFVLVAPSRHSLFLLDCFDNHGVSRANLKSVLLSTTTHKKGYGILVTNAQLIVKINASRLPKQIKI